MNTSFKETINEQLKARGLGDSSIKLYVRNLEKLNNDLPLKNLKFLEKIDDIKKKIDEYKLNTQRGFYISIVSTLSSVKNSKKSLEKLYEKYYSLMMEINKIIKDKPTEEKSESQSKNWMEWDAIINKLNEMRKIIDGYKSDKLTEEQYNILLNYIILSLYTNTKAPRRNIDYQNMKIVKQYDDKKMDNKHNYLSLDDNKFYFNVYKTAKSEGGIVVDIPEEFLDGLKIYMKYHPLITKKLNKSSIINFLVDYNGKSLVSINAITRRLNNIFNLKLGSSMLRHIYLSHKYGKLLEQQKEDAKNMSHTTGTQKEYIKVDKPIIVSF